MHEQDDAGLRVSPTGRVPQWVLDEAAGRQPVGPLGRDWVLDPPPPARRVRRGRGLLAAITAVVLAAGVAWYAQPDAAPSAAGPGSPPAVVRSTDAPSPGVDASAGPIGAPPPAPADPGPFGFVSTQEDGVTPIAYDPCRPVEVVVSLAGAPDGGEELVRAALERMTEVTGLQFRYQGPTDELPGPERALFQPDRYGDRWAPVLVGWRTPEEVPTLAGDVAGQAGSAWASPPGGPRVYVSGTMTLDGPEFARLMETEEGTEVARAIVLHEFGHVVGLQHVFDAGQLMYASTSAGVVDFADGDLAGLAQLGSGPCVPEL